MPSTLNPSEIFKTINAVRVLTRSSPSPEKSSRVQDYDRLISRLDDLKNSMMQESAPKTKVAQQPSAGQETSELPTTEETTQDLKRRLGKELYRIEMDLQAGARIAGKPCGCLCEKHNLGIEATVEELMGMDRNPVYPEILQWLKDHEAKFCPTASEPPEYYQALTPEVRAFRKSVMGTDTLRALISPSVNTDTMHPIYRMEEQAVPKAPVTPGVTKLEEVARKYGGRTEKSLDWVKAYERVRVSPLTKVVHEDINKAVIPSDKLMQFYASHAEGKPNLALLDEFEAFLLRKIRYIKENTRKAVYGKRDIPDEWFDTIRHPQNRVAQYTEQFETLSDKWVAFVNAKTTSEKVVAFDKFIGTVHGMGEMAGWFVEGGGKTLDNIRNIPDLTKIISEVAIPKAPVIPEVASIEVTTRDSAGRAIGGTITVGERKFPFRLRAGTDYILYEQLPTERIIIGTAKTLAELKKMAETVSSRPKPEVAIPKAEAAIAKEPWQMMREEWIKLGNTPASTSKFERNSVLDTEILFKRPEAELEKVGELVLHQHSEEFADAIGKGKKFTEPTYTPERYHKAYIQYALSEGKPVPAEVLKDYPDLVEAIKTEAGSLLREEKPERTTTMEERYTIDCSYCGFLTTERTLNKAFVTARRIAERHHTPEEKITIFDRLAQRGACQIYDIEGHCIGYKPFVSQQAKPSTLVEELLAKEHPELAYKALPQTEAGYKMSGVSSAKVK